jgi:hypothetical protein
MSVLLALLRGPTADGSERKRDELWNTQLWIRRSVVRVHPAVPTKSIAYEIADRATER